MLETSSASSVSYAYETEEQNTLLNLMVVRKIPFRIFAFRRLPLPVKQQYVIQMPPHNMVNFGPLAAEIGLMNCLNEENLITVIEQISQLANVVHYN